MTTKTLASVSFCVLSLSLFAVPVRAGQTPPGAPAAGQSAADLSSQATDPTSPLMAINFIEDARASYHEVDGAGFEFRLQPVIPYRAWGAPNILRLVVPYQGSGPGNEGLKSVAVANLTVMSKSWGRWGVGPVMSLDQSEKDTASKFLFGPAVGAVGSVSSQLSIGIFNQNFFGTDVGLTQIQPIVAYQIGNGWALSLGDLQITYDWEAGHWSQVPVGFQLGVVRPIFGQAMRFSVNPQWNLKNITGAVQSSVIFTIALLVPGS